MEPSELRKKSAVELERELEASCKAFFAHKLSVSMQQTNNTAKLKQLKRDIARVRTVIVEESKK